MNFPDTDVSYAFRPNAFGGTRTYQLTVDALTWTDEGHPLDGVFFDDIAEVRLAYAPSRIARNRYRTQVIFRPGGMTEFTNMSYAGFADFEDRSDDYAAFVRALHRRLAAIDPQPAFRKGSSVAGYLASILITVLIFAGLVVAALMLFNWGGPWIAIVKIAIILFFIPTLLRYLRRSTPATYDPRDLPADALPSR
ncbi:MAG: hypothetical protein KDK07_01595 [Bauldia sp.]|nr:hypothetical protein [Bauldia sp.]